MSCFYVVVVRIFLLTVLKSADSDALRDYIVFSYLVNLPQTRSAFILFVELFLHINQRLSSGIFSEFGSLSPNEAPGMSFSRRHEELVTHLVPSTLFSITQLFQITCCPLYRIYLRMF